MARPLRIEYPNACYHVINRGNRLARVFADESDYELFLSKLAEYAKLYDVVIYSYCLMPNHFHLQARTLLANLGKFMQSFITSFTLSMNRKLGSAGHLFQGRYKARLIDSELYKNKLSRYIHLNPVKINGLRDLPLAERKRKLKEYKWSSFRCYAGLEKKPNWLDWGYVLSSWGKTSAGKMRNYRQYVEEGLLTDNSEELTPSEISNIIGSDSFKDVVVKKWLMRNRADIDEREQPELAAVNATSCDQIIEAVVNYYKLEDAKRVTIRKGSNKKPRSLAMYIAGRLCRKNETLSSLAGHFGVKISGLNMARDKTASRIDNGELIDDITGIENKLKTMHDNVKK